MDDFVHSQGLIWLPHILRRLSNRFVEACDEVFEVFGLIVPPTMVSTVHLLYERGPQSVTGIAAATGQSHPLINNYVRTLKALGIVDTRTDPADRRRTLVSLTEEGRKEARKLLEARKAFVPAYIRLLEEADADLFDPLWRVEEALRAKSFGARILAERGAPRPT